MARRHGGVMQRGNDAAALRHARAQQLQQLALVARVQVVQRFVQQEYARVLRQHCGQLRAAAFATGKRMNLALFQPTQIASGERGARSGFIRFAFPGPEANVRVAAGQRTFQYRGGEGLFLHLRQQSEVARALAQRPGAKRTAIHAHFSTGRGTQTGQRVER